jgi:hypothetical protein
MDPGLLPSTGAPPGRYRFAMWTRDAPEGLERVGSFIPERDTIPIGVLARRR